MPRTLSAPETRNFLIDHAERLEALPTFREPTPEMYETLKRLAVSQRERVYTTGRGKQQIASELNMTIDEFEPLFIGKSVLDVGCGEGVLSRELARLKKTQVTALDSDPEMLSKIKVGPNLKAVEGSGYDLAGALGDEKFDVIVSSYSSCFWATDEQQKRASILSPIGQCATGGQVLIVPIIADINQRELNRRSIAQAKSAGQTHLPLSETAKAPVEDVEATQLAQDWLDVLAIDTLLELEDAKDIECEFLSSKHNARGLPLNWDAQGRAISFLERYSAIATLIDPH